jgi:sensor c-di-GMP phosphodiesterase-like protein
MGVTVDETREDGHLAEIDDFGAGWNLSTSLFADFFDLAVAD